MIRFFKRGGPRLLLMIFIGVCLGACVNNEPNHDSLFKGNRPPIANAGPDQAVASGALVHLNGSGSDPDGDEIRYEWRIISTPRGSNARLDTPASAATNFVADTDGVYHIQLQVIENEDRNLPAGAPIADSGLASDPDEVVVIAGPPGPFENSGNKLILDGTHSAITATSMDLRQASDLTAEGWFWINEAPAAGKEALIMGKKDFFEIVLTSDSSVVFKATTLGGPVKVGPLPFTLQAWHHLAAVVDQSQTHRAYIVLDGSSIAGGDFNIANRLQENANRFTIGGGEGREYVVGMADEVRVTQDIRYPEAAFDPPKDLLIPDSPFVPGARFAVHGLWHFDEFVGSQLFTDFSLRRNDLFLVGNTGFQPFGRLQIPRKFNTVEALDNGNLWIAGGIDDAGRALTDTEMIQTDGQIQASSSLNLDPIKKETFGMGDGSTVTFSHQAATRPVLPGSVTLVAGNAKDVAGNINGADDGLGHLTGIGIESGTIDYETGQMTVTFKKPPPSYSLPINDEVLGTTTGGGGTFTDTAKFTPIIPGSLSIMAGGVVIAEDDQTSQLNNQANLKGGNVQSGTVDYNTGSISITFKAALGNDVSISARYDSDNSAVIPGDRQPVLIDYSYDRRGGVFNHSATRLSDGKVLIAGGDDKDRKLISFATLFTPGAAKPIELVGPYQIPRRFHTAGLLKNGNVILVGGESDSAGALQTLFTTELFNPAALTFSGGPFGNGPNLNQARKLHRMIFFRDCNGNLGPQDDRFLITGGYDKDNLPIKTAEVYSNGGFSFTLGSMSIERVRHSVVCLSNGKMLITGGIDASGRVLDSAEVYDPTTNSFTSLQAGMNVPRADHTATLLKNGKVLIAGGFNQSEAAISSAEIYDPDQNLFLPLSTSLLGLARFGHVARPWSALGKDGVIIIGGMDATGAPVTLIEIFFP